MNSTQKINFAETTSVKQILNCVEMEILRRNTGTPQQTTFVVCTLTSGQTFTLRAQSDLDTSKRMVFITSATDRVGNPDWSEACLINAKEGNAPTSLGTI